MRRLIVTALLAISVCAVGVVPASAKPPVVGGPKSTPMSFQFTATGPQQHFLAETTANGVDPGVDDSCAPPRCYSFPFTVAPKSKGATGARVSSQITWTLPTSRFWLEIVDVTKAPTILAACYTFFTSAGPSATTDAQLKVGRKYAIWVTVEQVIGLSEVVKGVVHAPAKDVAPASPISALDPTDGFLNTCQG